MQSDEHEYSVEVPALNTDDPEMIIGIDKIGGGTLGSSYTGSWQGTLYVDGEMIDCSHMTTGMHKTHAEAAEIYADFMSSEREDTHDGDRLSLFSDDED